MGKRWLILQRKLTLRSDNYQNAKNLTLKLVGIAPIRNKLNLLTSTNTDTKV